MEQEDSMEYLKLLKTMMKYKATIAKRASNPILYGID